MPIYVYTSTYTYIYMHMRRLTVLHLLTNATCKE